MGNSLYMPPGASLLDGNGDPLNGGLVYFYEVGTSTAKDTYPTENDAVAQTNANANPVVLSSSGRAQIWLRNQYKVIVKDSSGNTIQTVDEVGTSESDNIFDANYITGLILSIDSGDTDHDIKISSGEARDGADSNDIVLSSDITKQIDAAWAVGDDAGGMDTGSVANNTIYYIWLIKRTDTGVEDALISASNSSPTMPTNYDKKRLIGVAKTDGSANLERVSSVNRPWDQTAPIWPDSGSANAYAITPLPALSAYTAGLEFSFMAENANTAAAALNISGLGAIAIQLNGNALTGDEIAALGVVRGVVKSQSGTNTFQMYTDHRSSQRNGIPTKSFRAYRSADVTTFTGDGTAYTCPLDSVTYNRGGAFDTSTYTFTAPSDGVLEGVFCISLVDASAATWALARGGPTGSTFGAIYPDQSTPPAGTGLTYTKSYSLRVVAAETVTLKDRSTTGGGGKTGTLNSGQNATYWTGRFIPD